MRALRTPDHRFDNLTDFPWEPRYLTLAGDLRMHYVEAGSASAPVVLMLHGEPSWSFLYRHMVAHCADAGLRVIAPDLIGFGRSDKPTRLSDYSYQSHCDWVLEALDILRLTDINLVCQDWGSLIGLRLAGEHPDRLTRIVVGNGFLPTGEGKPPLAFRLWRAFARWTPVFPTSRIIDLGTRRSLTREERRAYDAPFPSRAYQAGARAFPRLVPTSPDDPAVEANRRAWESLGNWRKPFLTTFSSGDPIMRGLDKRLRAHIPGCEGLPHKTLKGGHFLQEDSPIEFAQAAVDLIATT